MDDRMTQEMTREIFEALSPEDRKAEILRYFRKCGEYVPRLVYQKTRPNYLPHPAVIVELFGISWAAIMRRAGFAPAQNGNGALEPLSDPEVRELLERLEAGEVTYMSIHKTHRAQILEMWLPEFLDGRCLDVQTYNNLRPSWSPPAAKLARDLGRTLADWRDIIRQWADIETWMDEIGVEPSAAFRRVEPLKLEVSESPIGQKTYYDWGLRRYVTVPVYRGVFR